MWQSNGLLVLLVALTSLMGGTALMWARFAGCPLKIQRGRWLGMISLILMGAMAAVAAAFLHQSLMTFGLLMATLFIALVCEGPTPITTSSE